MPLELIALCFIMANTGIDFGEHSAVIKTVGNILGIIILVILSVRGSL